MQSPFDARKFPQSFDARKFPQSFDAIEGTQLYMARDVVDERTLIGPLRREPRFSPSSLCTPAAAAPSWCSRRVMLWMS